MRAGHGDFWVGVEGDCAFWGQVEDFAMRHVSTRASGSSGCSRSHFVADRELSRLGQSINGLRFHRVQTSLLARPPTKHCAWEPRATLRRNSGAPCRRFALRLKPSVVEPGVHAFSDNLGAFAPPGNAGPKPSRRRRKRLESRKRRYREESQDNTALPGSVQKDDAVTRAALRSPSQRSASCASTLADPKGTRHSGSHSPLDAMHTHSSCRLSPGGRR